MTDRRLSLTVFLTTTLAVTAVCSAAAEARQAPPSAGEPGAVPASIGRDGLAGVWVGSDRDRQSSEAGAPSDDREPPDMAGRPGGGRGGGGGGGGGGRGRPGGGGGGFGGPGRGRGGEIDEAARARAEMTVAYLRRLNAPQRRLTIVVRSDSVIITAGDGSVQTLQTNNKTSDERAENGLVKLTRRSRWDGDSLVTEIAIADGPRVEQRYQLSPGGTELRITTSMRGGRGGTQPALTRVYERPLD